MARTSGSYAKLTKPKISEIALHLFAERGYAAVSMRQIASKVGLQAGALYNYFPDKQTILADLLINHMENLLQTWHKQKLPQKPDKLLEFFVDFHIEYHLNRPEEVFIAYMELRNLNPDNFQKIEKLRNKYERILSEILTVGVNKNLFSCENTKVTSLAIIGMLKEVHTWYKKGGKISVPEMKSIYREIVLKAVT
ncbi:MAG: TetR/AcrR family transcriptional regulator [Paracoccaceae bacterium]|jgi:AcrR family transcriptional regulator|nr:TetR/AcrR family transcriptional regulator [Paracoccaceae bacterium]MDG2248134.1 TetR/AcrR family transcriptional regulator [Paracoccaceae bacterium]|tara:strand:- start:100 stop:684 length:585 start_codon:yes stop_codon:yes gene_type:complete